MGFEAILFDLGDTIVHFETSRAREFMEASTRPVYERLREWGFRPPTYRVYLRGIKWTFVKSYVWSRLVRRETNLLVAFARLHRRLGMAVTDEQMRELAFLCVPPIRQFFTVDPQAGRVISRLSDAGFKLGLVSNTFFPGFAIDDVLRGEGLLDAFPVRVYSSDVRYMKPHRRIFETALGRMGVMPERAVYVGDRIDKDVRGSARAGMRSMWLARKGERKGRATPDFIVRDLSEVPDVLRA